MESRAQKNIQIFYPLLQSQDIQENECNETYFQTTYAVLLSKFPYLFEYSLENVLNYNVKNAEIIENGHQQATEFFAFCTNSFNYYKTIDPIIKETIMKVMIILYKFYSEIHEENSKSLIILNNFLFRNCKENLISLFILNTIKEIIFESIKNIGKNPTNLYANSKILYQNINTLSILCISYEKPNKNDIQEIFNKILEILYEFDIEKLSKITLKMQINEEKICYFPQKFKASIVYFGYKKFEKRVHSETEISNSNLCDFIVYFAINLMKIIQNSCEITRILEIILKCVNNQYISEILLKFIKTLLKYRISKNPEILYEILLKIMKNSQLNFLILSEIIEISSKINNLEIFSFAVHKILEMPKISETEQRILIKKSVLESVVFFTNSQNYEITLISLELLRKIQFLNPKIIHILKKLEIYPKILNFLKSTIKNVFLVYF